MSCQKKPPSKVENSVEKEEVAIKTEKETVIGKTKLINVPCGWLILLTFRIVINVFSQRGYIHPDEFFQGPEIIAGDLFGCRDRIFRAWEFKIDYNSNGTIRQAPIRNIGIPYVFYGLPLLVLKSVASIGATRDFTATNTDKNSIPQTNLIQIQANMLIYYQRLFMTLFSLAIDICLFKLAKLCDLDQSSVIMAFASSYLTIVYLTRTFSNSIETILFATLTYLVIKSLKAQYILNDKFLIESSPTSRNKPADSNILSSSTNEFKINRKLPQKESQSPSSTIKRLRYFDIFKYDCLGNLIGLILCIGIFNRPTFLIYAFVPISYWILYGLETCNNFRQVISFGLKRTISLSKLFVPTAIALILIDTIYYYEIDTLDEFLVHLKERRFILTPYNFFHYNSNPENLAKHGSHPFYQHVVNCFMLFGINKLILMLISAHFFWQLFQKVRSQTDESSQMSRLKSKIGYMYAEIINNTFCFFIFSFLVPLAVFSLIDHKEPRFLLPLIIPVCLLTSHCLFGSQSYRIVRILWILFNILGVAMFGYFHQGGVIPAVSYTQKMFTHVSNLDMDQHVIFFHTYMPPRYLMQVPISANLINNNRYLYFRHLRPKFNTIYIFSKISKICQNPKF